VTAAECGRFAPSTTGEAHPGTLLAALLCWLDARSRGARLVLRLEDLDRTRCKPELAERMCADLDDFGLDWDEVQLQTELGAQHHAALDRLAEQGALYPCGCSRAALAGGRRALDGGWAYQNTCRERALPAVGWRRCQEPLRARLPDGTIAIADESGLDLSQTPARDMGDPIVRRRDGVIAYQLVVVADDAASAVTRVVRGSDLAASTATQVALQRLLGVAQPVYRHHLLLLEPRGDKLAKFHGAVGMSALRDHYPPDALCGLLAYAAGLLAIPEPCQPRDLLGVFAWHRIATADRVLAWTGTSLELGR